MDIATVTQIIGSLGFPIACCIALFWRSIKEDADHKEEMEKLRQTIENNTLILTKLYERLGGGN